MNVVLTIVLAVQMLSALGMIGLILVQHGKGADMGAAFGSGGSGSLFGASGSANFLSRSTGILAALFFACTLLLAYFGGSIAAAHQFQRAGRRGGNGSGACRCGFRRRPNPRYHGAREHQRRSSCAACARRIGRCANPDEIT
jgi:protein translocase SecG subunit